MQTFKKNGGYISLLCSNPSCGREVLAETRKPPPTSCPFCRTEQGIKQPEEPEDIQRLRKQFFDLVQADRARQDSDCRTAGGLAVYESALRAAHKALYQVAEGVPKGSTLGQIVNNSLQHVATARANLAGKISTSSRARGVDPKTLEGAAGNVDDLDAVEGNKIVAEEIAQEIDRLVKQEAQRAFANDEKKKAEERRQADQISKTKREKSRKHPGVPVE